MANFVVTHGGRAILNDIVLRGYIYALGGVFNGTVYANGGVFKSVTSPNGKFSIDEDGNFECTDAVINGQIYTPMFRITSENWMHCLILKPSGLSYSLDLSVSGINVQVDYAGMGSMGNISIDLPTTENYIGAKVYVMNNTNNNTSNVSVKCVSRDNVSGGRIDGYHGILDACFASFLCFNDNGTVKWLLTSNTSNY